MSESWRPSRAIATSRRPPAKWRLSPRHAVLLACLLEVSLIARPACRRDNSHAEMPKESDSRFGAAIRDISPPSTPADTVRYVHACRQAGRLAAIEPYLDAIQRPHVIALIQAVDRLAAANQVLQAAVADRLGPASARPFDRSEVVNVLGPFSRDLSVLGEKLDANSATVTIQVGTRLPLEEVHLERRDDHWVIRDDLVVPLLPDELHKLAAALEDVAAAVRRDPMTADQIHRELAAREVAVGRRINDLLRPTPPP